MGEVSGDILVYLILAALIGIIVGWLLSRLRSRGREKELVNELKQTHAKLDTAEGELRRQAVSLSDLHTEVKTQAQDLKSRAKELSAVEDTLKSREAAVATLESDLAQLRDEKKVEIENLREHIGTLEPLQGQLDESQAERNRLQGELQRLTDQMQAEVERLKGELSTVTTDKSSEIDNLKSELDTVTGQFRTEVAERDTTIERLESQLRTQAELKDDEIKHLQNRKNDKDREIEQLTGRVGEIQPLLAKVQQRQNEVDRLHHELRVLTQSKDEESAGLTAQIDELNQRLSEMDALTDRLADTERLSEELAVSQAEVERCRRELSALKEKRDRDRLEQKQPQTVPVGQAKAAVTLPEGQLFQRPAERDDLKKIKGIGPVLEKTLNQLGVTTFAQIGRFSQADIDRVSKALDVFPGRIVRDDWRGGARKEHFEKYGKELD